MIIKDNKQIKIIVFNGITAILLVLVWFLLYYFFENHGWLCSCKEECLLIHKGISWEWLNIITFSIIYLVIEIVVCRVSKLPFWNYAIIQVILNFALFIVCMVLMEKVSWFVPITGIDGFDVEYTRFRALINYFHQYIFTFFVSYFIMAVLHGLSIVFKRNRVNV